MNVNSELPEASAGAVDRENPWPGLTAFRESDRAFFSGRDREVEELLDLITREQVALLFGLSGLGKSSLLRAGLFPRLRQENILPVYLRLDFSGDAPPVTSQVLAAIAREAAAAEAEAPEARPGETLWEFFHRRESEFWSQRNQPLTPLLAFDQFEEVFTIGLNRKEETRRFLGELADLAEGRPPASLRARLEAHPDEAQQYSFSRQPCKILLSLREDFLAELEALSHHIRSLRYNRFRLLRMNGDSALRAVTGVGGHLIEDDVALQIVRFVGGRGNVDESLHELEIEPALLSVVCYELNNARRSRGAPTITADLLAGDNDQILSTFYEQSIGDLGPEVRNFVEEKLLTPSGFRDSVALENALDLSDVTREALEILTGRRLLRLEERNGIQRIELTHDLLATIVRTSRDARRQRETSERDQAALIETTERERLMRWNRWLIVTVFVFAALLVLLLIFAF